MDQNKTPIIDMLKNFREISPAYFCVPSHHLGKGADTAFTDLVGEKVLLSDVTETPLTDDLHEAEGAIKEAEELAAELFGADRTFFLVNGTTCGNEAMVISSVCEGEKILVARNCHKSVLMGLIISGATPVYIEPERSDIFNTYGSISPEKVKATFEKNPDIKAFILTSPTYYGISSDLEKIAEICHSYNALLLIDEAHGAHLHFSDTLPKSAILSGADMSAQSIHKTLGSMTQSSMLHIRGSLCDVSKVEASLKIVQSTSPSYILMASLDSARHNMAVNGKEGVKNMVYLSDYLREKLNAIDKVHCPSETSDTVFAVDTTRVIFSIEGMTGFDLSDTLLEKYNICTEMADQTNVIAVIGHGDSIEDMDPLINAVKDIAENTKGEIKHKFSFPSVPPMALTPRKAFFSPSKIVPLKDSVGKICGEMIAPYPPGIPVIYPGEIITEDIHRFIMNAVEIGNHIHGFSDKSMQTIKIIE